MRRILCLLLAALALASLAACGAAEETAPPVQVSETFATPVPATPEPTPEPVILTDYQIGGGVVMVLPEGFSADVMEDGSFFLTSGSAIVSGAWYDADYFAYLGADYPDTAEDAARLLIHAEDMEITGTDDRCAAEYIEIGQTAEWAAYAVVTRGDSICWKVEFICPASLYGELRASFVEWAGLMTLPDGMEMGSATVMTSKSGLFTLELPYTCLVIDEDTTAEKLALYGMAQEDAEAFLAEVRSRAGDADVVYRADFGAMLTVTADMDAGMTQAEMQEAEDELYIDESLSGADYSYEGVTMLEDNRNLFYLVRISHDGYDELGFTTYHDGTGASITFSFVGFSDDEARDILKTLVMLDYYG